MAPVVQNRQMLPANALNLSLFGLPETTGNDRKTRKGHDSSGRKSAILPEIAGKYIRAESYQFWRLFCSPAIDMDGWKRWRH